MEEEGGKYTHFVCSAIVLLLSHLTFFHSLFKGLPIMEIFNGINWNKDLDNQLCRLEAITAKHSGGEGSGSGNNNGTDWVTISKGVPGNKSPKECRVR